MGFAGRRGIRMLAGFRVEFQTGEQGVFETRNGKAGGRGFFAIHGTQRCRTSKWRRKSLFLKYRGEWLAGRPLRINVVAEGKLKKQVDSRVQRRGPIQKRAHLNVSRERVWVSDFERCNAVHSSGFHLRVLPMAK